MRRFIFFTIILVLSGPCCEHELNAETRQSSIDTSTMCLDSKKSAIRSKDQSGEIDSVYSVCFSVEKCLTWDNYKYEFVNDEILDKGVILSEGLLAEVVETISDTSRVRARVCGYTEHLTKGQLAIMLIILVFPEIELDDHPVYFDVLPPNCYHAYGSMEYYFDSRLEIQNHVRKQLINNGMLKY